MILGLYPKGFYFIEEEGTGAFADTSGSTIPIDDDEEDTVNLGSYSSGGGGGGGGGAVEYATYDDWFNAQSPEIQQMTMAETAAKLRAIKEAERKRLWNKTQQERNTVIPGVGALGNVYGGPIGDLAQMAASVNLDYSRYNPSVAEPVNMRPQQSQYTFNTAPVEWMGLLDKLQENAKKKKEEGL